MPSRVVSLMANEELLEVFRLGEAAQVRDVVQVVGDRLAGHWIQVSRFRDALALTDRSRRVQTSDFTLLCAGYAKHMLGDLDGALADYQQALTIRQEAGDRVGEAVALSNIGRVHRQLGDLDTALGFYQQALTIRQEVGDQGDEAATRFNIGLVHRLQGDLATALGFFQQALPILRDIQGRAVEAIIRFNIALAFRGVGRLAEAVAELEQVVVLDRPVGHPDLASATAMLEQVRAELAESAED